MGNADSMWNRGSYQRVMRSSKDIQKMLDIEDVGPGSLDKVKPLRMIDIIKSMYEEEDDEEKN